MRTKYHVDELAKMTVKELNAIKEAHRRKNRPR